MVDSVELTLPNKACDEYPEFAIICSFFEQFGDKLDLNLDIQELNDAFESKTDLNEGLVEIHMRLIRKMRRYVVRDQWEKALYKFAIEYSFEAAEEINEVGYLNAKISTKLELLKRLLEAQFDYDNKFKNAVDLIDSEQLNLKPTGRDNRGNIYWTKIDKKGNFRVFKEDPLDYKSWSVICRTIEHLSSLLETLNSSKQDKVTHSHISEPYDCLPEIFPEYFTKKENSQRNQVQETIKIERNANKFEPNDSNINENDNKKFSNHNNVKILPLIKEENILEDVEQSENIQVKSTLESIINKVVSSIGTSFENLIKPFSYLKSPQPPQPPRIKPLIIKLEPTKKNVRKKNRFKEETLPRRTSSRIQKLQAKKVEEEMKKQVESIKVSEPESASEESSSENFSPNSSLDSEEIPVYVKKARTARTNLDETQISLLDGSTIIDEDTPCSRCDKSHDPDLILLCDMCDAGYHTMCCHPPLMYVPDGDWFCPNCEHQMLTNKLTECMETIKRLNVRPVKRPATRTNTRPVKGLAKKEKEETEAVKSIPIEFDYVDIDEEIDDDDCANEDDYKNDDDYHLDETDETESVATDISKSTDEDEEEEEDDFSQSGSFVSNGSSYDELIPSDNRNRSSRRAASKPVCYNEDSDDDTDCYDEITNDVMPKTATETTVTRNEQQVPTDVNNLNTMNSTSPPTQDAQIRQQYTLNFYPDDDPILH